MKKAVIGLRLEHLWKAFVGSIIGLLALFLPYVSSEESNSAFGIIGEVLSNENAKKIGIVFALFAAASVLSVLLAVVSSIHTTVSMIRFWAAIESVKTICVTVLLFASKIMLDGTDIMQEDFLVKKFGIGYWIALIAAYFTLTNVFRTAKVSTGYIVLVIMSVIWLFPILWIVLTAFRGESGYYVGYFWPKHLTFDNFKNLFNNPKVLPFGRWWMNSFIVAVCGCVINTIIILATAYVLSRTRFKGRTIFMRILMIIGMFPGFMSMIALYNILKGIGLNQSLVALVIVGAAGAAMGYHVTKGFFDTIPKALDEAAIIDGASRFQIFTKITIPLSKSIIVYTVLTNFLGVWSDFIFPKLLFGDKQSSYTVAVGLQWMTDFRRIDAYYTQFAAGSLIVAVPIVILFIWLQQFYVEGLSGAVKG